MQVVVECFVFVTANHVRSLDQSRFMCRLYFKVDRCHHMKGSIDRTHTLLINDKDLFFLRVYPKNSRFDIRSRCFLSF